MTLQLLITPERREQDAEADVAVIAAKHGHELQGDYPRYLLTLASGPVGPAAVGSLPEAVLALLVDLSYAATIRNVAVASLCDDSMPDGAPLQRLQIDDFLAASRSGGLVPAVWYRVHAPAGYRCRP